MFTGRQRAKNKRKRDIKIKTRAGFNHKQYAKKNKVKKYK